MAAELSMNGRKKIETIQKEFTNKFNYLTLLFLDEDRKSLDISKCLSEVRKVKGTDISINAGLKVNTLEARFIDNYGLMVEVAYMKDGKVMHTKDNVDKTLNEMNRWCEENGCDKFEFKKSLRGDTVLSLQEQLFNTISEQYPDAVAKKMNKDNFMDVHLPTVNSKKGTHIFFNTAKEGIKFGFYCRDEEFVKSVLDKSSNIEQYAQGVRPAGNPLFTNVEDAAEAALDFIREMMGELDQNEVTNDDNDEKNDSGNNSIKLNAQNASQLLQEIKNNKNQKSFEIKCYTKEYSDMTYVLKFKVEDSVLIINRVNWSNDSYWSGKISKKELVEALNDYKENSDMDDLIDNHFHASIIDYQFDGCGELDNGLNYNFIEMEPELITIPEEFQDEDGDFDIWKLTNDQWPENEELTDKNIGTVSYYQIITEDKIYELKVGDSNEDDDENEDDENDENDENETDEDQDETDEDQEEIDEMVVVYEDISIDKYKFIDTNGNDLFGEEYDEAEFFNNGFAKVKKDNVWNYLDQNGKFVNKGEFEEISLGENEFLVKKNNLYGYANLKGEIIIDCKYDAAAEFSNGFAKVTVNGKVGYINAQGKEVIPCIYDEGESFEPGCVQVQLNDESIILNEKAEVIWKLDPYQYYFTSKSGLVFVLKDDKYGYIDLSGKLIIPHLFEDANEFCEEVAVVTLDDKKSIINKEGKIIAKTEYTDIENCTGGLLRVLDNNENYGYIDVTGKEIIACKFEDANSFESGYAEVTYKGKKKIIDKAGKFVVKEEFDSYFGFSEGFFTLEIDGSYYFIDLNGKKLTNSGYDEANSFSGGYATVKKDDLWGAIDIKGNEILPFKYKSISNFEKGIAMISYEVLEKREKFNGLVVANTHPINDYKDFDKLKSIIKENYSQIRFADILILENENYLSELISANADIYPRLPLAIRTKLSVIKMALENGFYHETLIQYLDLNDEKHLYKVIESNYLYFKSLPEKAKTRSLTLLALVNDQFDIVFDDFPKQLQNDQSFFEEILEYFEKNRNGICNEDASIFEGYSRFYADNKDFILKYRLISYASDSIKNDREFLLKYLKSNPESFTEIIEHNSEINDDYDFVKTAVSLDPNSYRFLKEEFREDSNLLDLVLNSKIQNILNWLDLPERLIYEDDEQQVPNIDLLVRINQQNDIIADIPDSWLSNDELIRKLIYSSKHKKNVLYYAPDYLRKDKAFVGSILKDNILAITFAHKSLLADRDFMLPVIKQLPIIIKFCSDELKSDKTFVLEALKLNGLVCKYIPETLLSDPEVYWIALHQNVNAFVHFPDEIKKIESVQNYVADLNGELLNGLPYNSKLSKQTKFKAILNSPEGSFKEELVLYKSFEDNISDDLLIQTLQIDPTQVVFLNEKYLTQDSDRLLKILSTTAYPVKFKSCRNLLGKERLKSILIKNSWAFKYLDEEEKNDDVFIRELLKINGLLLQYCNDSQRENPDFVKIAFRQNTDSCRFISEKFDWDTETNKIFAYEILAVNPQLISCFLNWEKNREIKDITEFFFYAFALDSKVLDSMEQPSDEPWWFVTEHYGSYPMSNDDLSYGLCQDGSFIDKDPVFATKRNICLALENGKVTDDWPQFFENCENALGKSDIDLIKTAFSSCPNEWTYEELKKQLGKKFIEKDYVTPNIILKYPDLYESLSDNLKTNPEFAYALLKSEEMFSFVSKFKLLHPSFKSDKKFLQMIANLNIDFYSLLSFFNKNILLDESFLYTYLINNFNQFPELPDKFKDNRKLALQYAICNADDSYLDIPKKFISDKDFFLDFSKNNLFKKFKISDDLFNDISVLKEMIKYQPQIVSNLPDEFKSEQIIVELIKINPQICKHLENELLFNPIVFDYIIKSDASLVQYFEWSYVLDEKLDDVIVNPLLKSAFNYFDSSIIEDIEKKVPNEIEKFSAGNTTSSASEHNTLFHVNAPCVFTLGYDTNCYVNEDVAGVLSDEMLTECLESESDWSDYIWDNSWYDADNIFHKHGIIEPATDLELPNGERIGIKLNYSLPKFNNENYCFENSTQGDFLHISTADEKSYGWENWKKYSIEMPAGIFDVRNIEVEFEYDIVSSYNYRGVQFDEDENYNSSGKGFTSSLYFNNGEELVSVDINELREELSEEGIDLNDIEEVKQFAMKKYGKG